MDDIDNYDRKILAELQADGRITVTKLADRVGLSKTPCQIRMRKLEERGFIKGYAAIVDPVKLEAGHIAFVQVSLTDTRSAALEAFNASVGKIQQIEQCHMIAGQFDYLLKVRSKDIAAYRKFLGETISELPHVSHTSTFVVMQSVKETSASR